MDDIDAILGVTPSPQREARAKEIPIPLPDGKAPAPYMHKPRRRLTHGNEREPNAIKSLGGLPPEGEQWHFLTEGNYDMFDLVSAMLHYARPAPIEELRLATLGFNHRNAAKLLALHDAGQVRRATMLVSVYFEADHKEAETCYKLARELPARGGWYCATRCHAKIIAARFAGGRHIVIEGSANLRTCRQIEQFIVVNDRGLYDWHAEWMEKARAIAITRDGRYSKYAPGQPGYPATAEPEPPRA